MSYPQDDTWNEKGLECPGCGYVHEAADMDGAIYPRSGGIEHEIEEFECESCGLIFDGHVEFTPHWTAEHPRKCDVKGYHIVTERKGERRCLYCDIELTCDCEIWTYEKATEDNRLHGASATIYIPMADRRGHCKHQINNKGLERSSMNND